MNDRRGKKRDPPRCIPFLLSLLLAPSLSAREGEIEALNLKAMFQKGIPPSPFIGVVYRYADAMLKHGRDTHGPQETGLFLSALDRKTLSPLANRPAPPAGVPPGCRPGQPGKPLLGANPQLDQNLLRLLYFLKGLSGEDRYPRAADESLKWFLENTQFPATGLYPWGEHLSWDTVDDRVASGLSGTVHEFYRPWMLWARCFELAPEASERFALGLWNSHVGDHDGGARDPRAASGRPSAGLGVTSARQAGFSIRTWAEAHAHTKNRAFTRAIEVLLTRHDRERRPKTGAAEGSSGSPRASSFLSLAIDCDGAARKVEEPLRTRLARVAAREDEIFCSLPHDLEKRKGFAASSTLTGRSPGDTYTPLWEARHHGDTTASVAMMCVSRYENTGRVEYRDLIVAAADAYLDSLPPPDCDGWPMTFGHAISLELAAFRVTAREEYFRRAFKLGDVAVKEFFGDSPLPRASLKTDHYESTTGADTLVLSLAELHLTTLHITAVRVPVNTIDR